MISAEITGVSQCRGGLAPAAPGVVGVSSAAEAVRPSGPPVYAYQDQTSGTRYCRAAGFARKGQLHPAGEDGPVGPGSHRPGHAEIYQLCADFRRRCHVPAAAHSGGYMYGQTSKWNPVRDCWHSRVRLGSITSNRATPTNCNSRRSGDVGDSSASQVPPRRIGATTAAVGIPYQSAPARPKTMTHHLVAVPADRRAAVPA